MRALTECFDRLSWHLAPARHSSNAEEAWALRDPLKGLSRGFESLRDVRLWWQHINLERAQNAA